MPGTRSGTSAPTHPLMDRLLEDLQQRNIQLDEEAQSAIEQEFFGRLARSADEHATLEGWEKNMSRFVDLLEGVAGAHRRQRALNEDAEVTLSGEQVRSTFITCGRLCPGPA
jgi:hypothetical protein